MDRPETCRLLCFGAVPQNSGADKRKEFMRIKTVIPGLIAAAGLLSLSQVQAQTNNATPPMGNHGWHGSKTPEERMNRLSEKLNLTDEQKTKVQAVFEDMWQQMGEAKSNANTQLQQILTPEQYQELQNMKQRKHHRHHHGDEETGDEQSQEGR